MSLVSIRTALETKLNSLSPSLATAWENVSYTPITGTAYQQVNLVVADTLNPTIGDGHYRIKGFLQVLLCYPSNAGAKTASARADALVAHFKRGTTLTSGGISVLIDKTPRINPPIIDGDRYKLPVTIYFSVDIFS